MTAVRPTIARPDRQGLAWAALVIGGLAVLSWFALITDLLYPLIPIGRFGGLLVLLAFAIALPATVRRIDAEPAR